MRAPIKPSVRGVLCRGNVVNLLIVYRLTRRSLLFLNEKSPTESIGRGSGTEGVWSVSYKLKTLLR